MRGRITALAGRTGTWVLLAALVFFAVSLHRVGAPPTDRHDWRQTLMLLVARAWTCGQPALKPTIEVCGPTPAPMAMELPLYAYLGAAIGQVSNPWIGARLAALLGACCAVCGIALLGLDLLPRGLTTAGRMAGTLGAGLVAVAAPLPQHWLGSLLPDPFAWGAVLLSAGLLARGSRSWGRLASLSLLAGIGVATKLYTAPFVLVTLSCALTIWLPARFWRPSSWPRWIPAVALHLALAVAPALLWYGVRNRAVLRENPCTVFIVAAEHKPWRVLRDPATLATLRAQIGDTCGALLGLAVPGLAVLLLTARLRAAPLVAATLGALVISASLGPHMRVHEYSGLYWTPLAAASIGTMLAVLGEGARRLGRFGALGVVGAAIAWSAIWTSDAVADRQALRHSSYFLEAGHDVNQVLDPTEGFAENAWENPLLTYFAGRRTRVLGRDFVPDKCEAPAFDCAAASRDDEPAECWLPRTTVHVFFESVEVHCGLTGPRAAPARVLARLRERAAKVFDPPLQLHDGGGGSLVAVDDWSLGGSAGDVAPGARLDLYVEGRASSPIGLEVGGAYVEAKPPERLRALSGRTVVVYRARLPRGDAIELHIPPSAWTIQLEARTIHPSAWDCAQGPH